MVFKERPNYLNDIEEVKRGILEGRIKPKHIRSMIRNRKMRIKQLEQEIRELEQFDMELIKRF